MKPFQLMVNSYATVCDIPISVRLNHRDLGL